ncbi:acylase [Porphyrobacter sp. GA68]|uniref:acylase n=1 Tax=Porphyrobacter sp. GA68 TaxID=2883480 RepID=UPI001D196D3B|nr:acylase [Porphyrobacter sp. GA68]
MGWKGSLGFGTIAVAFAAFILVATWEPFAAGATVPPPARTYRAEIIRDEFGVPHIYGRTDADVAYGVAVAHAQDDFFTLQDVVAMSKGRYGAIAGAEGARVDYVFHLLDARGTAEREFAKLPADTQALFHAYAAGLNQYAAAHPGEVKLARLFPVNGVDVAAGFALRQPFFFGLDAVIGPLVEGEPLRPEFGPAIPGQPASFPGDAPAIMAPQRGAPPSSRRPPLPQGEDGALSGSNAFAVTPGKSGGPTILVSNSHQPWRGGVAWYELVVESGEGWHFAGANFPGSPFPFLGHNRDLGWTNTVNRADLIDVYRLELDSSGTRYRLDGRWLPLQSRTVILPVRFGPITLPIPRTIHRSVHGPVIRNAQGAFAIRYAGIGRLGQLDAYYRLNKARTLAQWEAVLARMDIPSTNFIYGDRQGNIAFVYNAAIPDRAPAANWRGVLPGNSAALIWRGPVAYDRLPRIVNPASGWLYNANNQPYSAAGRGSDLDPGNFPPEMGIELTMTNRAYRAARLLEQSGRIDRRRLEEIKYDTGYERVGYVAHMFNQINALDLSDDPELARARRLLNRWDFTSDNVGRADALSLLLLREWMSAQYQNRIEQPDPRAELAAAVHHLKTHFNRLDPPMSELLRLRQGPGPNSVDLPFDGGSDTLRAATMWDVDADGRLAVRHGDSFIQWVEWQPGQRVSSRSVQPFGAATTRPRSMHFADQSTLFVQHRLKPVRFWREDVLANAASRQVVANAPR